MRRAFPILLIAALTLAACKGKPQANATTDDAGAPQVATSIEDYALPVDKSAQITSIDAATGDASGMPKDGGAVVQAPKHEAAAPVAAPVATEGGNAQAPAVPPVTPPPAKPAFTIEDVPGTK